MGFIFTSPEVHPPHPSASSHLVSSQGIQPVNRKHYTRLHTIQFSSQSSLKTESLPDPLSNRQVADQLAQPSTARMCQALILAQGSEKATIPRLDIPMHDMCLYMCMEYLLPELALHLLVCGLPSVHRCPWIHHHPLILTLTLLSIKCSFIPTYLVACASRQLRRRVG